MKLPVAGQGRAKVFIRFKARPLRNRSGMNLIELIFVVLSITIGMFVAAWAGRELGWYGYLIGFVGGFLVIPGACELHRLVCRKRR
jgi:hypothetical protein